MGNAITFAIPFYKNRAFLERAVLSVLAQADSRWSLIISDDASKEDPREWIEGLRDSRIQIVRNPSRLGMVGNWNRCLELAQMDLVTILHSDDELLPDYTARMLQAAEAFPQAVALFCRAVVIDGSGKRVFSFPDFYKTLLMPSRKMTVALEGEEGVRRLLKGNFLFCPTVCFRKSVLGAERFSENWKMVQDLDLWTRLLIAGKSIVGIPDFAYAYRRHDSNSTVEYTKSLLRFEEESALYLELASRISHWPDAASVAQARRIIKLNTTYCLASDVLRLRWKSADQKARFLAGLFFREAPASQTR